MMSSHSSFPCRLPIAWPASVMTSSLSSTCTRDGLYHLHSFHRYLVLCTFVCLIRLISESDFLLSMYLDIYGGQIRLFLRHRVDAQQPRVPKQTFFP